LVIGGGSATGQTINLGGNSSDQRYVNISTTKTVAFTIQLPASRTTTIDNFNLAGTPGNLITIGSTSASINATLTKGGGGSVVSNYLSISYITATPSDTWYAGTNSTDGGNNTGWSFTTPPPISYGFRLSNTGILYIPTTSEFDEITQPTIGVKSTTFYASQFDEITNPEVPVRYLNNGIVQTQSIIDEITGIS
jgi:hypothetical protein